MIINVIRTYKDYYLFKRKDGSSAEAAHAAALNKVKNALIAHSAGSCMPVKEKDLHLLQDLESNVSYRQLLEDMQGMNMQQQKSYLQDMQPRPLLQLVK